MGPKFMTQKFMAQKTHVADHWSWTNDPQPRVRIIGPGPMICNIFFLSHEFLSHEFWAHEVLSRKFWRFEPWSFEPWIFEPWSFEPWSFEPWSFEPWSFEPWTCLELEPTYEERSKLIPATRLRTGPRHSVKAITNYHTSHMWDKFTFFEKIFPMWGGLKRSTSPIRKLPTWF